MGRTPLGKFPLKSIQKLGGTTDLDKHNDEFADVTLSSGDNKVIRCHRFILAHFSPFFQKILRESDSTNATIILMGTEFVDLQAIIFFMYSGKVNIPDQRLLHVLEVAKFYQIKGMDVAVEKAIIKYAEANKVKDEEPGISGEALDPVSTDNENDLDNLAVDGSDKGPQGRSSESPTSFVNGNAENDAPPKLSDRKFNPPGVKKLIVSGRYLCQVCKRHYKNLNVLYNHRSVYHREENKVVPVEKKLIPVENIPLAQF